MKLFRTIVACVVVFLTFCLLGIGAGCDESPDSRRQSVKSEVDYMDCGDGTVVKTVNGKPQIRRNGKPCGDITWQKVAAGPMTYSDAVEYCANLSLGGRWDWRLPTFWELKSIAVQERNSQQKLSIHRVFAESFGQQNGEATVWAYSSAGSPGDDAALCYNYFSDGEDVEMRDRKNYVLAVADTPH